MDAVIDKPKLSIDSDSDSDSDSLSADHDRVSGITNRPKLPSIVGGSNSFIRNMLWDLVEDEVPNRLCYKLLDDFDPDLNWCLVKPNDEVDFDESWTPGWSLGLSVPFGFSVPFGLSVPEEGKEIKENPKYLTEKQMWKIQRVEAMEAYRRRCRRETARFRRPKFGKDKLCYRT